MIFAISSCLLALGAKIIAGPTAAFCISYSFISGYSVLLFGNLHGLIYMMIYQYTCVFVCVVPPYKVLSKVVLLAKAQLNLLRHERGINLSKY